MDWSFWTHQWSSVSQEQRSILLLGIPIGLGVLLVAFIAREIIWKSIVRVFRWIFKKLFPLRKPATEPIPVAEEEDSVPMAVSMSEIGTHVVGSRVAGGVQPVSLHIGTMNGPLSVSQSSSARPTVTFPPLTPEPSVASSEEVLSEPPKQGVTVELDEKALSICGEIEKYFQGNSDSIRTEYAKAQEAKAEGKRVMAAGKYIKIFNSILRLLNDSPYCSTQELRDLLSELKHNNIEVLEESFKVGNLQQTELDACELHIMGIFTKFPL